jgi:hypothetical protein
MQNRYVGDVGDFAKYALLRSISSSSLRLAVIWYLYPDETHNSDGRHVSYLDSEAYRALDHNLHTSMKTLVHKAKRHVSEVRKQGVLLPGTIFFEQPLVGELGSRASRREEFRRAWFIRARAAAAPADIVFLDPDNGVEVRSVPKRAPKAGKYVFWDEISALWDGGHSLLIYHHLNRTVTVSVQTKALARCFSERLSGPPLLMPLLFRRGSCRHFWILGQTNHVARLKSAVETMLGSGWGGYFEIG